jgi:hypothetical protein
MELYQRSQRSGRGKVQFEAPEQQLMNQLVVNDETEDDFLRSIKCHMARYTSHFINRVLKFLNDEALKSIGASQSFLFSTTSSITSSLSSTFNLTTAGMSNNFITHVKTLKANIFLINNESFMMDFVEKELKSAEVLNKLHSKDTNPLNTLKQNINVYLEKAFDLFNYIESKWTKAVAEGIYAQEEFGGAGSGSSSTNQGGGDESTKENKLAKRPSVKYSFMDTKKKRKEEFIRMIRECIDISSKVTIVNEKTNQNFREKVKAVLLPIFCALESTGELAEIAVGTFNVRSSEQPPENVKELLLNKMFPLS